MDDQERQYEEFARRAQERRRMVEARRLGLEQRMRERQQAPEPDAPAWWDDEEEEEEEPLHDELPSPWIEEHEAPLEFPARREEAPSLLSAARIRQAWRSLIPRASAAWATGRRCSNTVLSPWSLVCSSWFNVTSSMD